MKEKAEIKKIVVQMGKKEIPLSIDDAKKLYKVLEELFGEKVIERHHHHTYYDYWRYRPYWDWPQTTIWCSSGPGLDADSFGSLSFKSDDGTALLALTESN